MNQDTPNIRSESWGSHWVAWTGPEAHPPRDLPVLMVGRSREEAEERMQEWLKTRANATRA